MDIFQQIILGMVQGITEWIPISSKSAVLFVSSNFLGNSNVELVLRESLFLHLGTFLAALFFFRKQIGDLFKGAFNYHSANLETKKMLQFIFIATFISGIIGLGILQILNILSEETSLITGTAINFFMGSVLILTGLLQLNVSKGYKKIVDLKLSDGVILGILQGFAAIPGVSRSGVTVSGLLFRKFDDVVALRLSFIMSLPLILLANIFLNIRDIVFMQEMLVGFFVAFIFGLLSINFILKFAEKVKFGHFAIIFGVVVLLAGIISLI
ncbi:undecaprenyl-diphosphate phosphatase [Candidatus Pacearchaeota archaeon]|nr:undecaprenyl-diphosphate phosphatase [Candidatus Pacearchaeota archaeon]